MKYKLSNYIKNFWIRNFIFILISLILLLPFLINGELITWADSQFHITRLYEIIKQQQHGQYFPDIVQYSGLQNWGYGLNLFYPPYALLPLVFLWRLLDNPVMAFILFDIFIVYFALAMNFRILKKATQNLSLSFLISILYILTASAGTMPPIARNGMNIPVVGIVLINQLTSNIVFLFAPVILVSFYQIIFRNENSYWKTAAVFSALSAMLSIPATLGLVITVIIMFIIGVFKKKINTKNITTLFGVAGVTILLSAIFIVPLLEQRLYSSWGSLPNRQTLWGKSFFDIVVKNIFNFSDILSVFVVIAFIYLLLYKKLDKSSKILAAGYLLSLLVLHSSVFPWWLIQNFFAATLQYTSRWEFVPRLIGSIFVARVVLDIAQVKPKIFSLTVYVTLIFSVLGMYGNTLSTYFPVIPATQETPTKPKDGIKNESFEPVKTYALKGRVYLRVNSRNIRNILDSNFASRKELGLKPTDPMLSSLAFNDYRIQGQYRDHQKVYANSLVKFNGKLHKNMTSVQGEEFLINNLPKSLNTVQAPITYLKGFKAYNDLGNELVTYKNGDGFLEIKPQGSENIKITYEKTFLHKGSIVVTIFSWIILCFGIFLSKIKNGKRRHAKTFNSGSSI
ncbi:hypothetical protein [Lactococcus garvieae]|uniref:Uncharacterized protein n=1 Tax=Lactococcus garvieae DCC43 TaxID=1231377 RepID=K2PYW3_9LACT|nr:hypothetical protein [Lactococcus garvieae]EKF52581.1 hypothetical protein C426_0156 [Lactococcus garvieae DCC43]